MLSYKRWSVDSLLRLLLELFLTLVLLGVAAAVGEQYWSAVPEETRQFWLSLAAGMAMQVTSLVLVAFFLRENALGWREAFGLSTQRAGWMVGLGVAAAAVVFGAALVLISGSRWLMELVHLTPQTQTTVEALRDTSDWTRQVAIGVTTVLLAPVFEEVLFRGLLYPAVKQTGLPRTAFWGTALLFAASHLNLLTFLPLVFFAVVLTMLYERTDNLLAPIVAHAAFNLTNFLWVVCGGANN